MNIPVAKIVRSRRKTLVLQIKHDASLVVRAPFKVSTRQINEIIHKKRFWITKARNKVIAANRARVSKRFVEGEKFLYLGSFYPLRIIEKQRPALLFDGQFRLSSKYVSSGRQVFRKWYAQQAARIITSRIDWYISSLPVGYNKIRITNAKHRWGSCSNRGNLNFSWRLILARLLVVDYVVVHEIVHLLERNHSGKFWAKVSQVFPKYLECRKWLKENEPFLAI